MVKGQSTTFQILVWWETYPIIY